MQEMEKRPRPGAETAEDAPSAAARGRMGRCKTAPGHREKPRRRLPPQRRRFGYAARHVRALRSDRAGRGIRILLVRGVLRRLRVESQIPAKTAEKSRSITSEAQKGRTAKRPQKRPVAGVKTPTADARGPVFGCHPAGPALQEGCSLITPPCADDVFQLAGHVLSFLTAAVGLAAAVVALLAAMARRRRSRD